MKKIFVICLIILFALCTKNNTSNCINKSNNFKTIFYINNIGDKDIKIEIEGLERINSAIKLDETYESYSIITMDITNLGLEYTELSNINCSIYQGEKKLQTFVQSQNDHLGFVGTLKSGESRKIKLGVVLEEKNTPLKLVFENLSNIKREKFIKIINI